MRITWRGACKFSPGATFVGTIGNGYLCVYDISVPFPLLGITITSRPRSLSA